MQLRFLIARRSVQYKLQTLVSPRYSEGYISSSLRRIPGYCSGLLSNNAKRAYCVYKSKCNFISTKGIEIRWIMLFTHFSMQICGNLLPKLWKELSATFYLQKPRKRLCDVVLMKVMVTILCDIALTKAAVTTSCDVVAVNDLLASDQWWPRSSGDRLRFVRTITNLLRHRIGNFVKGNKRNLHEKDWLNSLSVSKK